MQKTERQWLHDKVLSVIGNLYLCKLEGVKFGAEESIISDIDFNVDNLKQTLMSLSDRPERTERQLEVDFKQREMRSTMTKYEGRA